jgi:hypothetical protein
MGCDEEHEAEKLTLGAGKREWRIVQLTTKLVAKTPKNDPNPSSVNPQNFPFFPSVLFVGRKTLRQCRNENGELFVASVVAPSAEEGAVGGGM